MSERLELNEKEVALIKKIREVPYGEFQCEITMKNGKPIRIKVKPEESVML